MRNPDAPSFLFAFVHLKKGEEKVFIVPPGVVAGWIETVQNRRPFFWIYDLKEDHLPANAHCRDCTAEKYLEKWEFIDDFLAGKTI